MATEEISKLHMDATEAELRAEIERLRRRNAELERSSADFERFLHSAGHDLREPLRTISSYAQLLGNKCNTSLDGEVAPFVGNIMEGVSRTSRILTDMLAYASVNSPPEEKEAVDLNAVVDRVKQNLHSSIAESKASIISETLPCLNGHFTDFVSLFQNLLSNAIKYRGGAPPSVRISVRHDPGELKFAVADEGIGVDPYYHEYIFEPFRRLSANIPGTGLGLAICQRVVSRYDGRIWVESEKGHGSTFRFTLPDDCLQTHSAS